jgi:hypothetical protein
MSLGSVCAANPATSETRFIWLGVGLCDGTHGAEQQDQPENGCVE